MLSTVPTAQDLDEDNALADAAANMYINFQPEHSLLNNISKQVVGILIEEASFPELIPRSRPMSPSPPAVPTPDHPPS